jgi:glucose/mannose-6-phosphate isomerase
LGLEAAKGVCLNTPITSLENIIICGVGGSAMPGEILFTLRCKDIFVYKGYNLPLQAVSNSLIVCISYSGETEETLSSFQEAMNRKLLTLTITRGGKLEELSKKYNVPCAKLLGPSLLPRLAIGEMFAALVQLLVNHRILDEGLVEEILELEKSLKPEALEEEGKKLSKKLYKKIPFVYASRRFREIGLIWKNSFNETAKILAIANFFPELNHNEIVGFWKVNEKQISNKKLYVIILRDPEESHPRTLRHMEITKELLESEGVKVEIIDMKGKSMLEKIFSTVILGFWTSYWLALRYRVDPTPIKMVDEVKRRLKEK